MKNDNVEHGEEGAEFIRQPRFYSEKGTKESRNRKRPRRLHRKLVTGARKPPCTRESISASMPSFIISYVLPVEQTSAWFGGWGVTWRRR